MKDYLYQHLLDDTYLPEKRYQTPFLICFSGLCGSGKTTLAKYFSFLLSLYLVSGDQVRNQMKTFDPNCDVDLETALIDQVTFDKIRILHKKQIATIMDRNISCSLYEQVSKLNVPFYLIRIVSDDDTNITRVKHRSLISDPPKFYGDHLFQSNITTKEDYLMVKGRTKMLVDDQKFDYTIDVTKSFADVFESIKKIAADILQKQTKTTTSHS